MNDDIIRYILELACNKHARRNVCSIEARLAVGENGTITKFNQISQSTKWVSRRGQQDAADAICFEY